METSKCIQKYLIISEEQQAIPDITSTELTRECARARISYYLTYVVLTVSDREQNYACSCTFPSTEGTYLRHDLHVEQISSRHATHENCMNCARVL